MKKEELDQARPCLVITAREVRCSPQQPGNPVSTCSASHRTQRACGGGFQHNLHVGLIFSSHSSLGGIMSLRSILTAGSSDTRFRSFPYGESGCASSICTL